MSSGRLAGPSRQEVQWLAGPDPPAARRTRARQLPGESRPIVLALAGRIGRADAPPLCRLLGVLLDGSDADLVVCDVGGVRAPDAGTLDALARLTLSARRSGRRILLSHASSELRELLALAGLADVVPCATRSPIEPSG